MIPQLYSHIIDGQGPDLLILHGFLGMSDNWKTLGKRWADAGYRVHLIDQRNHGRSFWSHDFSYEVMATDLQNYIEANQLQNIRIIGHSMGGKTVMYWLGKYTAKPTHAVIADIAPRAYPPHHQEILETLSEIEFDGLKSRAAVEEVLGARITDPGLRMFLMKNVHRKADQSLGLRLNIEVLGKAGTTVSEELPRSFRSSVSTLFLGGAQSDYIRSEDHQQIYDHFPQAQIDYIPDAGHWLHAQQPELFYQRVELFFES